MNKPAADEMIRPVRVYTDIPQSLDIAIKIHCAKIGKTRKQYLAEIIRQTLADVGAIPAEKILSRQTKKG